VSEAATVVAWHLKQFMLNTPPAPPSREPYGHMGATICDAILQAGLNYRTVVAPRVDRILRFWPTAQTTTAFYEKAARFGLTDVLLWSHAVKLDRVVHLTEFLFGRSLDTEDAVADYLSHEAAAAELLALPGVGPKTLDYLKILVGIPTFAVDRHLRRIIEAAGVTYVSYDHAHATLIAAAGQLGLDPGDLDLMLWTASAPSAETLQ
jgi:hypothetical protein